MKKILFVLTALALLAFNVNAQTKKDGTPDMRYNSNKESSGTTYSTPTTTTTPTQTKTNNSSRPVYDGQTHTTSHGGTYVGGQNSQTHKGGTYTNPKSNNNYGIHKTK